MGEKGHRASSNDVVRARPNGTFNYMRFPIFRMIVRPFSILI